MAAKPFILDHQFSAAPNSAPAVKIKPDVTFQRESDAPQKNLIATFNELILQYQDTAYNFALYLLGDPDAAEDAVQQAFINAYLHYNQFRGTHLRGWLLKIVKNECFDELRRLKRHNTVSIDDFEDEGTLTAYWNPVAGMLAPEKVVERKEAYRQIQAALYRLDKIYRAVIILVDIQGLDYQETAQVLDIPTGTLKSRLARARRQFRNSFQN